MNYMQLCNKVIQESAAEQNELTLSNWNSPEAGRRLYPRIKRLVAEAWKMLQMERDEWEFKSVERSFLINPKMKVTGGYTAVNIPTFGDQFRNERTGDIVHVVTLFTTDGDWEDGDWEGQIEFTRSPSMSGTFVEGDTFVGIDDPDAGFVYRRTGSYDLQTEDPTMREIQWTTFVARNPKMSPTPLQYVPWSNWMYLYMDYTVSYRTLPQYVSKDFEGKLTFYPQTFAPFTVSFVYDTAPQILTNPEDVPVLLKEEYHDWIAWRALEMLALYDKNTTLLAWAKSNTDFYRRRANKELMPIPRWGSSEFEWTNL